MSAENYELINIAIDLEKKLKVYENNHYHSDEIHEFGEQKYIDLVDIILNLSDNDIVQKIKAFNKSHFIEDKEYYSIHIKNKKIIYPTNQIDSLASELFNILYRKNKETSFQLFSNFVTNKVLTDGNKEHWFKMSFKDDERKKYFLDEATKYIIDNQTNQEKLFEELENIDSNNDYRLCSIVNLNINNIPKNFNNLFEMYQWFTVGEGNNYLHEFGSNFTKSLLLTIIDYENTNLNYSNHFKRINKILEKCDNDPIIMNQILNSFHINIKLNIFLLAHPKYTQFGLLNIFKNNEKEDLLDREYDYSKEWQELTIKQAVNIHFKHYNHPSFEKESIFDTLNYLAYYSFKYEVENQYLIILEFILNKFENFYIECQYEKVFYFNKVISKLIDKQIFLIESSDTLEIKDYFFMSWYLEKLIEKEKIHDEKHNDLILKITNSIELNIKKHFTNNLNKNNFYLEDKYLKKINFSLLYNLSEKKSVWLELIDIKKIDFMINKENKLYIFKVIEYYFSILLDIYINNLDDKALQKHIIDLSISFGIKEKFGIFHSYQDNSLLFQFFKSLNYIEDDLFDKFIDVFLKNSEIKQILQIYTNTFIDTRKEKIYHKFKPLLEIEQSFFWLPDIEETILLAFNHNLNTFANKLIVIYEGYLSTPSGKHKDQSGLKYVRFKKDILEIYQNKELSQQEKLYKLNGLNISKKFDFKNYRVYNKLIQVKEYENFIRALIFFNDEPIKTFKLLRNLFSVNKNSLYLFNMLNAYFNAFQNSNYKIDKYINLLNDYQTDIDQLLIQDNSLFSFQVLFFAYSEVGNHTKLNELYNLAPSYYKQILQKELPSTLKLFDKQIHIKSKLLVCVEGQYDIKFLKNINSSILELKDIIDIKDNSNIAFFDLKGSNLQQFVKDHNLQGTNIIELHIYDSDKGSGKNENKYNKECEEVKNRDDQSFCFMTKKRELENYIPKDLIEKKFGIDMSTIKNWDIEDIPTFIRNKTKDKTEKAIKCILNGSLSKQITKQKLEDLNAFDEIKSWFEKIKELSSF